MRMRWLLNLFVDKVYLSSITFESTNFNKFNKLSYLR